MPCRYESVTPSAVEGTIAAIGPFAALRVTKGGDSDHAVGTLASIALSQSRE
jgi:hypothetical protein